LLLIGAKGGINASSYRAKVCSDADNMARHVSFGVALFPTRSIEGQYGFGVSNDEIEQGKAQKEFPGSKFGNVILSPTVVICTAYRPTFNSASIYHTVYIVDLFRIDSSGNMLGMFTIGEDVDSAHLRLRFNAIGGVFAD
jgi:hypothetical protein